MTWKAFFFIMVMALVTYGLRLLPMVFVRDKIRSPYLQSFFHYIPYTILAAMTVPTIFYSTGSILASAIAFAVAVLVALIKENLLIVALAACAAAYVSQLLLA